MFNRKVVSSNKELEHVQKAVRGDHDAFRHLVLAYEAPVLAYLQSILGDWENARDITQETFIAAFYALPSWQPPGLLDHPLAPWLYRIATNQALTFLKQQGRRKRAMPLYIEQHAHARQGNETVEQLQGSVEPWEDRYVVRELLHEALSQLSEEDALCITLRFIAGERYAEIAERLGITKEAVRKRVARGLVVLRSVYKTLVFSIN